MMWLRDDLQSALRSAARRPGFALAVLLSLGVGIGAAAAVGSLVNGVLLTPLPYQAPDKIVGVWFSSPNFPGGLSRVRQSAATYVLWRDRSQAFEAFALAERAAVTVDDRAAPQRITGAVVTPEVFRVLSVVPVVGRGFDDDDNLPGADPTVILAFDYWATRFGSDPAAVGKFLTVDGVERRIVGVLPRGVRFPEEGTQLWLPLEIDPANLATSDFIYTGYARLGPGVDLEAASRDFARVVNLLPEVYPSAFPRPLVERLQLSSLFVPLQDELVGGTRQPLLIALLTVLAVLAIVVANVVNLFLVRNEARRRDLAVLAAIGAGPGRLARTLVVEGLTYGAAGALLGLGFGAGALALLKGLGSEVVPRIGDVHLDAATAGAVVGVALVVGLIVGAIPAARLRRLDLNAALRAGGKSVGASRRTIRVRRALVVAQVALALALLVNSGLLIRSFSALQRVDLGFAPERVLGLRVYAGPREFPTAAEALRFYRETVAEVRRLPGVEAAAGVTFLPLRDGRIFFPFRVEEDAAADLPSPVLTKLVTEDYFQTMDIRLVAGRGIASADLETDADVAVVSEAFARQHWPTGDVVGRRISFSDGPGRPSSAWLTVVGVVQSVRDRDVTADGVPIVSLPLQARHAVSDRRWREFSLAVRSRRPAAMAASIRRLIAERSRGVPVYAVRTMDEVVGETLARTRYTMLLVGAAAAAALFLAAVGLYGVLSYIATDRRREMGLRLALGATPASVRAIVIRQALALVGAGTAVGVVVAVATNRVLLGLLFGVQSADPATIAGVAALLVAVTWMAARIPAARAAAVPPAITLRED